LEAIREQNPIGRILLIADNAGGHHAKLTQKRADELGIEFVYHFEKFVTDTFLDLSEDPH